MRSLVTTGLLLLAGFGALVGSKDTSSTILSTTTAVISRDSSHSMSSLYVANGDNVVQNLQQIGSMPASESPRHRQEKALLMKRIDRKTGKWGTTHPRYRLLEALYGFTRYQERNMAELNRWRTMYTNVNKQQKKALNKAVNYKQKLDGIEELIYINELLCKDMVDNAMTFYSISQGELDEHIKEAEKANRVADRISTSQTLKHFVRDWANEGSKERNDAFPCILNTLKELKSISTASKPLKILLPGSGVGRLGSEVANLGNFSVTLNEWSMYMNVGYRYITSLSASSPSTMHPFVDNLSHHATTTDLLRSVTFPDMSPNPSVLLVEGDFTTAFKDQGGQYDIILTHFFIDTARNLMSYFDTIHRLLAPGGRWVNLGPLLYGTGPFVQLSLDEIVAVVEEMGFEFEDVGEKCGKLTFAGAEGGLGKVRWTEAEYGFNGRALTRNAYKAQVWIARKKA